MKNLAQTQEFVSGKIYIVESQNGNVDRYRVLAETPSHFIFYKGDGENVDVIEKAKKEIVGIYEVKDWVDSQEN
ncbi:hypothetical protein [Bacillus marasmi]|uniref:hypothetical protein n=1 Tax=Bacillus marasmi TaxID=1926279 RepID=UPI0011CAE404|nr:hypothetical protein [Bacillus marasmi]